MCCSVVWSTTIVPEGSDFRSMLGTLLDIGFRQHGQYRRRIWRPQSHHDCIEKIGVTAGHAKEREKWIGWGGRGVRSSGARSRRQDNMSADVEILVAADWTPA